MSPERAQQIEAILLRMVQAGQLRGRVSEEQLIGLLDQVSIMRSDVSPHISDIGTDRWGTVEVRAEEGSYRGTQTSRVSRR